MPKSLASLAAAVLAVLTMGAAQQPPPAAVDPLAAAPRISVAEAKSPRCGQGRARGRPRSQAYQAEHAKGALSIPLYEVHGRANELPKDKQIITYCT